MFRIITFIKFLYSISFECVNIYFYSFIFQQLPESKQVLACSATYTQELLHFLGNYMQSATHVTPGQDPSPILIGLRHFVCIAPASLNNISKLKHKESCLLKILNNVSFLQCLVFSNHHNRYVT